MKSCMKKTAVIALTAIIAIVMLVGCTAEDMNVIFRKVLESLGYGKSPLEITELDADATMENLKNAGLTADCVSAEDIPEDFFEKNNIDPSLKPLRAFYAVPPLETFSEKIQDDPEALITLKIAAILEYESQEDAEKAAKKIEEILSGDAKSFRQELEDNGVPEEISSLVIILKDFINVQVVDGKVAVYTTPAKEMFSAPKE